MQKDFQVVATFEPNIKTEKNLNKLPNEVLYVIAKETLDMTIPHIPMSVGKATSGSLRRTSASGGVRSGYGGWYIGSYTDYATHVWNMDDNKTNWTTPDTHSEWYARTLKKSGQVILDTAVNRSWKETM